MASYSSLVTASTFEFVLYQIFVQCDICASFFIVILVWLILSVTCNICELAFVICGKTTYDEVHGGLHCASKDDPQH